MPTSSKKKSTTLRKPSLCWTRLYSPLMPLRENGSTWSLFLVVGPCPTNKKNSPKWIPITETSCSKYNQNLICNILHRSMGFRILWNLIYPNWTYAKKHSMIIWRRNATNSVVFTSSVMMICWKFWGSPKTQKSSNNI